jgi:DNA-binding transcriptional regulator YhcF (GntR family)
MMRDMRIAIDPLSAVPVSEQLVTRLRTAVERGRPAPGERLPPVRELAADLGLAPNTVAKAYRALERDGYLVARGRAGTFVVEALPARPDAVEDRLREAAAAFARRARQLGARDADALDAVRRALRGRGR